MKERVPRRALLGALLLILLGSLHAQNGNILKFSPGGEIYTVPTGKTFLLYGVNLNGSLRINGDTVAAAMGAMTYLSFIPPMLFQEGTDFSSSGATSVYGYESPVVDIEGPDGSSTGTPLLAQSFPNPWFSNTTIEYQVPSKGRVTLRICDGVGRLVTTIVDGALRPGSYRTTWDGTDDESKQVAAGTYFYKLSVDGKEVSRKTLRLR